MKQHKTIETGHADRHNPPSYLRGFIMFRQLLDQTGRDLERFYSQATSQPISCSIPVLSNFRGTSTSTQGLLTATEPNSLSQRVSTFKLESTSSDMDQYSQVTFLLIYQPLILDIVIQIIYIEWSLKFPFLVNGLLSTFHYSIAIRWLPTQVRFGEIECTQPYSCQ